MTEDFFWKCAISRADDHTRKRLKVQILHLKQYFGQTWKGEFDPSLFTEDNVELMIQSPERIMSEEDPKGNIVKELLKAFKEGKSDSRAFILGRLSLVDLAKKLTKKVDAIFKRPIKSPLEPTSQSDLNTMEVGPE